MSNFSFETTAGASHSTAKPQFAGNAIYDVTFDGCEIKDIQGVKDASMTYKTLSIKFSNEDGYFNHTVFEPKESDGERVSREFTDNTGKVNIIPQPSNIERMMLLFKHLIDAVNPELAAEIDAKTKKIGANTWEQLREVMVKATQPGIGKQVKIKLVTNNKGEAAFPFYASVNRDGQAYVNNNIIGEKIFFSTKELTKINTVKAAKPSSPSEIKSFTMPDSAISASDNEDLNFDLV